MIIIHQNIYFGYLGPPDTHHKYCTGLKGAAQQFPSWTKLIILPLESVTRKYLGFISLSALHTSLSWPLVSDQEFPRHIKKHIFYGLN